MEVFPKNVGCGYVNLSLHRVKNRNDELVSTYLLEPVDDRAYIDTIATIRKNFGKVAIPMTGFRTRLRVHPDLEGVLFQVGINCGYGDGLAKYPKSLKSKTILSERTICFLFKSHVRMAGYVS